MGLGKSAYRRYKVIDGLLKSTIKKYPKMQDIIEACWEKLDIRPSPETIQKDLAIMKLPYPDGFDAPIYFNRQRSGYEYTDPNYSIFGTSLRQEDLMAIYEAVDVIRSIGGSRVSKKFSHAVEKLLSASLESNLEDGRRPVLQTMTQPLPKGFEHFDLLYAACLNKAPISILHFSFSKRTHSHFLVHPFLVKEFDNRWYVIGYSESHRSVRTFGLDSISEPYFIKKRYTCTPDEIINQYLNDMYGVIPLPEAQLQEIEISVKEEGTLYFQSYKLHNTQEIYKHGSGKSTIRFNLIPTVELARYFNFHSRQIVVKKPASLVKYMKNIQNE